eukprot:scaffold1837_cov124-Skeletonema_menzelii.AAC.9
MDETTAIQILKLLIEEYPQAVMHTNNDGRLPIHIASGWRSPDFCRVLIEAYRGSERISGIRGTLPLHWACALNTIPTVEYLYRQYPDAINHATPQGYPIHAALAGTTLRDNPATAAVIVQFLLDCDPNQKLKQFQGMSLLHFACQMMECNESNIEAGIQIIKIIFDAHPEAIEDNRIASDMNRFHPQVQAFINRELVYARQAKDHRLMTTPDDNGQLPLHTALQNNVRLGSIKLLVKGNPSALRTSDNNFAMPLHIACEHHDSASIIHYLVDRDMRTLRAVDIDNNTVLHYACRGAKYETIALLLEMYDALSVSKRNAQKKLPIDLLWESTAMDDRESIEYTDSIFRLLKAYPETVMACNVDDMTQQAKFGVCKSQNGKKRKLGAV